MISNAEVPPGAVVVNGHHHTAMRSRTGCRACSAHIFQAAASLEPWSFRVTQDSCLWPVTAQTAGAVHAQITFTNMYYLKQRNFQETFFAGSVLR